jgi:hypothetical protein
MPCGLQIAKAVAEAPHFDRANLRDKVEGNPVARIGHRDVTPVV